MKKICLSLTFVFLSIIGKAQKSLVINELNPSQFKTDFTEYNQATALYCGQLSEAAYLKDAELKTLYKEVRLKYSEYNIQYSIISDPKTNARALLWCNKDFLVVSFKGTEPSKIKDLITDAKFWNYENNPSQNDALLNMPPGHGGFRKSLINLISIKHLMDEIDLVIKKSNPDADVSKFPVFLTGYSLGAAISQLFIECLKFSNHTFSGAYHFAPPLAVACEMNNFMKTTYGTKVYDIINYKDFIPRAGRLGVAHFGKFYRICDDNCIYKEQEAYVKFNIKEYPKALKYHKLSNHLEAIRKPVNSISEIVRRSNGIPFPCMGKEIDIIDPCKNDTKK